MAAIALPARVANRGGDRVDSLGELLEAPCVAGSPHLRQPLSQRAGSVTVRRVSATSSAAEIRVEGVLRPFGEQHEAGRHGMHRRSRPGPVAHLHRVVGLDLVDVVDLVAVRQPEAGVLTELADEIDEEGVRDRDQIALRRARGGERRDAGTDPPANAVEALDRVDVLERREQPRHGRLRQPYALRDGRDAGGAPGHLVEDRERALERLHHRPSIS